ncbi:fimbrial protein [Pseudomonas aeruginosa]|uniref:fimbrial protein n=1 Tax=Pseudomonas aeruginosa TaxID=287 RepID=UPI00044FBFF7|nr:fimbrial protein [Pseudomonas aeruginosa]ETV21137.1 hypothetical protein Q048_05538 [Pseudomonas aeruginosa BWHPSA043]KHE31764.1 fimbrial protein [Pseudomonas aeruginosa]KSD25215.1 fimbrial protein [Pseudomonas aeruginosa]KSL69713.1 fimbrial protein [Pseudomonas aeruginosa]KSM82956.1 fimbrial protein [Pseudomonas aeruginosa]
MKYALSPLSLASAIALAFSGSANAIDGTITITGEITDTTCSISVNGASASGAVSLPAVSTSSLSTAGMTAGTTPFSIALSGCSGSALSTARTWFEPGVNVDSTTGRLNNTGSATNVQVQLLNKNLGAIVAGGANVATQNDVGEDISSGSGTLNYYAQYYATSAATAGAVTTSVEYTIVYD